MYMKIYQVLVMSLLSGKYNPLSEATEANTELTY